RLAEPQHYDSWRSTPHPYCRPTCSRFCPVLSKQVASRHAERRGRTRSHAPSPFRSPHLYGLSHYPPLFFLNLHYHNSTVSVSFPTGHILEAVALPAMALSPMSIQKPVSPCMVSTYHFPVSLPLTFDRF
ncbi:mCG1034232, partial [Mus musculus]